jgi:hypothetical protein
LANKDLAKHEQDVKMVERLTLVNKHKVSYEGIFSLKELYITIDNLITKKGYNKKEIQNTEIVKKGGRYVTIRMEVWKKMADYANSVIQIKMMLQNIKDIEIEKEGIKISANQGKAEIIFDAYIENDFEHKWENTPGFFFVRILFDKYIFKPFTTNYQAKVITDYKEFLNEITAVLNLNKY